MELVPCLCYRADRTDWSVILPLFDLRPDLPIWEGLDWTITLSLPAFCALVRESAPLRDPARVMHAT